MPLNDSDRDLADRLSSRTLELVNIPSESHHEAEICAHALNVFRSSGVEVQDLGDTCLYVPPKSGGKAKVILAGHFDTVPAQGNIPGRRDEDKVWGLGSSDMKAGVAVMMELALARAELGCLFFGREELAADLSALAPVLAREKDLLSPDLAIVMEPTDNDLHAGCLGNINATWSFTGRAAHSARPWQGVNAIHLAAEAITELAQYEPRTHTYQGLNFVEVVSVTKIAGGVAGNIVPDTVNCHVNYRFPPGWSPGEAERSLRSICHSGELAITSIAPSAPVVTDKPLVQRLMAAGKLDVKPKQAWTPVAEFAVEGIDAVNFGPGTPSLAHQREEAVSIADLVRSYKTLEAFASEGELL